MDTQPDVKVKYLPFDAVDCISCVSPGEMEQVLVEWYLEYERMCLLTPALTSFQIAAVWRSVDAICNAIMQNSILRRLAVNRANLKMIGMIYRSLRMTGDDRAFSLDHISVLDLITQALLARTDISHNPIDGFSVNEFLEIMQSVAVYMTETDNAAPPIETFQQLAVETVMRMNNSSDVESTRSLILPAIEKSLESHLFIRFAGGRQNVCFTCSVFQDYFTAKRLVRRTKDVVGLIRKHRFEPQWTMPIILTIQMYSRIWSQDDAEELIEDAVLSIEEIGPTINSIPRVWILAARCLMYFNDSRKLKKKVADGLSRFRKSPYPDIRRITKTLRSALMSNAN